jgi:hypothetical protein
MATLAQLESRKSALDAESNSLLAQARAKADENLQASRSLEALRSRLAADPSELNRKEAELALLKINQTSAEVQQLQNLSKEKFDEGQRVGDEIIALINDSSTIKTPTATNPSKTEEDTEEKYADPTRIPQPDSKPPIDELGDIPTVDLTVDSGEFAEEGGSLGAGGNSGTSDRTQTTVDSGTVTVNGEKVASWENISTARISSGVRSQVNGTAIASKSAQWSGAKDLRAILRVPSSYLIGPASGPAGILKELGGIMYPYTPEISYDTQANYASINPLHSNYTQYYYKNSTIGSISVNGKFTVQNEKEGMIFLGIQHLLRSLTKMRFGTDKNAGSPPPVCRFDAYGDYMISNVPVVVASFKVEMSSGVDYIAVKSAPYKTSLVPTVASINITLNTMYSRSEISRFSVDSWLNGNLKNRGYL